MRKSQEWHQEHIRFLQADLLELGNWPERFSLIECSGVLHHMSQYKEAWRLLTRLLYPHGIMNIGLYSAIGHQDIVAAKQVIAEKGFSAKAEDIRSCRQYILGLPDDSPAKRVTPTIDFYVMSTCRDLLFHEHVELFTLPKIAKILEEFNLKFLGFNIANPLMKKKYVQCFPDDPEGISLANWDYFEKENPETFRGMYQFWVQS